MPSLIERCGAAKTRYAKAETYAQEAAVNGDPDRVRSLAAKKEQAKQSYLEARAKVQQAIDAYRSEGLNEAATAVYRKARGPCGL